MNCLKFIVMLGPGFGLTCLGALKDALEGAQERGSREFYESPWTSAFCGDFLSLGVVSVGTMALASPWPLVAANASITLVSSLPPAQVVA